MIKNISSVIKKILGKSDRYDDSTAEFGDEYTLLVNNRRIVDYSNLIDHYGIPVKLGIYMDTFNYLKAHGHKAIAKDNINKVLDNVLHEYKLIMSEKFSITDETESVNTRHFKKFERLIRTFKVSGLVLSDGKTEAKFCVNLLIRPEQEPFIIIGKAPKGKRKKIQTAAPDTPLLKMRRDTPLEWDYIDFE